jgi:T5SS/PEP-CTERM-associated repeat protein
MTTYYARQTDYTDTGGATVKGGQLNDPHTYWHLDDETGLEVTGIPGGGDVVIVVSFSGHEEDFSGSISGVGTWTGGEFKNGASLGATTVYDAVAEEGGTITADDFAAGAIVEGGKVTANVVHGTLTVDGDTSVVNVSRVTNEDESTSTGLTVSGGNVTVTNVQGDPDVGVGATVSGGTVTITNFGIGSKQAGIIVGDTGNLTVASMTFGQNSGDTTTVSVDGSNAVFTYATGMPIGDAGQGEIDLSNGASLDVGNAILGNAISGQGKLLATGGAHFDITSLSVGVDGYGYFRLTTAASANVAGDLTVGQGSSGYGMFVVTDSSSDLEVAGAVTINNGNGDSEVSGGGKLDAGSLTIAGKAGMRPGLNISGDGSLLTVKGAVVIGDAGNGTLTVTSNAQFTATGQAIVLASQAGSRGMLTLTDAAGNIGASELTIGDAGIASVSIKGGAEQTFDSITLGAQAGSSGLLTVGASSLTDGDPSSKITVTSDLVVGDAGGAAATIYGTASIGGGVFVGDQKGANANFTVQGAGANVTVGDSILLGEHGGTGHLAVNNGAHLEMSGSFNQVITAYTADSSINVLGDGTELHSGSLLLKHGTLKVQSGALLDIENLTVGVPETDVDALGGPVTISGEDTKIEVEKRITLLVPAADETGNFGYGFSVTDGAEVSASSLDLDTGRARIEGANSALSVNGNMWIGNDDTHSGGNIDVTDKAKITITGFLFLDGPDSSVNAVSEGYVEVGGNGNAAAGVIRVDPGHKIESRSFGTAQLDASNKVQVDGEITVSSGQLNVFGGVHGHGEFEIEHGASLFLNDPDVKVNVNFKEPGGHLSLNLPERFDALLTGLDLGDSFFLRGVKASFSHYDAQHHMLSLYTNRKDSSVFDQGVTGDLNGRRFAVAQGDHGVTLTVVDETFLDWIYGGIAKNFRAFRGGVQDGYISGATIFGDANGNGMLDKGEVSATSNASGGFSLKAGSGRIVAVGGTDVSTGLAFTGVLSAPTGATVLTPLTTLIDALQGAGIKNVVRLVDNALGFRPSTDLLHLDQVAGTEAGDAARNAAYLAGVQVQSTEALIAAALAGPNGDQSDFAGQAVGALAGYLASHRDLDLTSKGALSAVATNAGLVGKVAQAVGAIAASTNAEMLEDSGGKSPLSAISETEAAVLGNIAETLADNVGDNPGLTALVKAVTTANGNDAPSIVSNGGEPFAAVNVTANKTAVLVAKANDPHGEAVSWSIDSGADKELFKINSQTGALSFKTAPHRSKAGDNIFEVVIKAENRDGLADRQVVDVTVTGAKGSHTATTTPPASLNSGAEHHHQSGADDYEVGARAAADQFAFRSVGDVQATSLEGLRAHPMNVEADMPRFTSEADYDGNGCAEFHPHASYAEFRHFEL